MLKDIIWFMSFSHLTDVCFTNKRKLNLQIYFYNYTKILEAPFKYSCIWVSNEGTKVLLPNAFWEIGFKLLKTWNTQKEPLTLSLYLTKEISEKPAGGREYHLSNKNQMWQAGRNLAKPVCRTVSGWPSKNLFTTFALSQL